MTLPSTDSDRMDQAGIGSTPHHPHRVGTGSTPSPVEAGLKPAPTATPHTAEDRIHLCENATIHTTRGAGEERMTPALHPYPAYKPSGIELLGDVPGTLGLGSAWAHREDFQRHRRNERRRNPRRYPMHSIRGLIYLLTNFTLWAAVTFVTEAESAGIHAYTVRRHPFQTGNR